MFVSLGVPCSIAFLSIQHSFIYMYTCFSNDLIMLSHGLLLDQCACDVEGRGMHEIYVQGLTVASVATVGDEWRRKGHPGRCRRGLSGNAISPKSARLLGMIS